MFSWWLVVVGIGAVVLVLRKMGSDGGLSGAVAEALRTGEVEGLVAAIEATPAGERPTHWDQAINSLWQAYSRETATRLVMEAAQRSEADIVQYWLRKVMEVEPEIASEHFTEEFLLAYFRPEVAARCGGGGCGTC